MLIDSDKYILEEKANQLIFRRVEELNNFFTKFFIIGAILIAIGVFFLIHIVFEGSFLYHSLFFLVLFVLFAITYFFKDDSPPIPYLIFNKKKRKVNIHNGFEVPYERIKQIKVEVWVESESHREYCSISMELIKGPDVFNYAFESSKTNWKVFANIVGKEVQVEYID